MKEFVCIGCPRGCNLQADDNLNVTGNFCIRGKNYAVSELTHPVRNISSTVKVNNRPDVMVSVKTSKPIPKEMIFAVMEEINKCSIDAPCHIGDIVISNVLKLEADIVITKEIK